MLAFRFIILLVFLPVCAQGGALIESDAGKSVDARVTGAPFNLVTPEDISRRGVVNVCILPHEQYPFLYATAQGLKQGLEYELLVKLAAHLGVELNLLACDADQQQQRLLLNSGEVDMVVAKQKIRLQGAKSRAYSLPYFKLGYAFAVNRKMLAQKRLHLPGCFAQCEDIPVAYVGDEMYSAYIGRLIPQAKIINYTDRDKMIDDIQKDRLFAIFGDEVELRLLFQSRPHLGINLQYKKIVGLSDGLGIAVSWKNWQLLSWVNQFIQDQHQWQDINQLFTGYAHKLEKMKVKNK